MEWLRVQQFFLEASARTYAAGAAQARSADFPGAAILRHIDGDLNYTDCYYASGSRSIGQTIICLADSPVWGMHYYGRWDETDPRVIPFLKRALMAAYVASQFYGGRGPGVYQEGLLVYRNSPQENTFVSFRGYEEVLDSGRVLFWHRYGGMALVEGG